MLGRPNWRALLHRDSTPKQLEFRLAPKRKEDKPVSLHPLSFEDALKRMLQTPPVNPAKRKRRPKRAKKSAHPG